MDPNHKHFNQIEIQDPDLTNSSGDVEDVFLREVDCSARLGVSVKCLRGWTEGGHIKVYSPFGSRVRLYYWPEVRDAILGKRSLLEQELEPVGRL